MKDILSVSRAEVTDVPDLVDLINNSYRPKGETAKAGWTYEDEVIQIDRDRATPTLIQKYLDTPNTIMLKCVEKGQCQGQESHQPRLLGCLYLQMTPSEGVAELGPLSVQPNLQGRGIGKLLVRSGEALAKAEGCTKMELNVLANRVTLVDWYSRMGYLKIREIPYALDPEFGVPKCDPSEAKCYRMRKDL